MDFPIKMSIPPVPRGLWEPCPPDLTYRRASVLRRDAEHVPAVGRHLGGGCSPGICPESAAQGRERMLTGFDLELPGQKGQHGRGRLEALVAHGVGSTLT